jgi:hypothetical protein
MSTDTEYEIHFIGSAAFGVSGAGRASSPTPMIRRGLAPAAAAAGFVPDETHLRFDVVDGALVAVAADAPDSSTRKLRRAGDSVVVSIPREELTDLGFDVEAIEAGETPPLQAFAGDGILVFELPEQSRTISIPDDADVDVGGDD